MGKILKLSQDELRASEASSVSLAKQSEICVMMPGALGFVSGHVLINSERAKRGRCPLHRSVFLDRLCQLHAKRMAENLKLAHSVASAGELEEHLVSDAVGENVQRGPSVVAMHEAAMEERGSSAYKNIVSKKFVEFGVGTALGEDGKLYMCQLFRGPDREESDESESTNAPELLDDGVDIPGMLARARLLTGESCDSEFGHGIRCNASEDDDDESTVITETSRPGSVL